MRRINKYFNCIIILFILCGCFGSNSQVDSQASLYLNKLKNYEPKIKNKDNTVINEDFAKFLDDIFLDTISESYTYMHFVVSDYKTYGIDKPEVKWADLEYEGNAQKYIVQLNNLLEFNYDELSYVQQYDYDLFEYSLLETICLEYYSKYDSLYSRANDIFNGIIVNLEEFKFYDKESFDDYLILLADTPRYIDDILDYGSKQIKDNICPSKGSLNHNINYIDSYVSKTSDNSVIVSFKNSINDVDYFSNAEKEEYINKVDEIVNKDIIPAFNKANKELKELLSVGTSSDLPLSKINKNFAELVLITNSSYNNIDELFNIIDDYIKNTINNISFVLEDDSTYEELNNLLTTDTVNYPFNLNDKEMLEYLKEHLKEKFPDLGDAKYTVSRLDESSASDSTVAYFVSPPLDDLDMNVIRTNPNIMGEDPYNDYSVLAHEGFPGHLYQHIYFHRTEPSRFRETQSFSGYTEGYATYVMCEAYDFAGFKNEGTAEYFKYVTVFDYLLLSLMDIGFNYYEWSKDDAIDYLADFGLDEEYADYFYEEILDNPGTFDRYGAGCACFYNLREYAKDSLGNNFDDVEFNKNILIHGELPFCILKVAVDEYIEENK